MPTKRLILLLDGAWNDSDVGPTDTDIVRLRDLIARHLQAKDDARRRAGAAVASRTSTSAAVSPGIANAYVDDTGMDTLLFYESGVGAGAFD